MVIFVVLVSIFPESGNFSVDNVRVCKILVSVLDHHTATEQSRSVCLVCCFCPICVYIYLIGPICLVSSLKSEFSKCRYIKNNKKICNFKPFPAAFYIEVKCFFKNVFCCCFSGAIKEVPLEFFSFRKCIRAKTFSRKKAYYFFLIR